jgi:predicted hydrolase (HD superfamily)
MASTAWARDLARQLLAEALPQRWAHTQGVGKAAVRIAHVVGGDAELLVSAAWLHDLGYTPELVRTGFHPLDGARYLRDKHGADERLCRLVANHSCADIEAGHRHLGQDLAVEFPAAGGLIEDALLFCDMTTSPTGAPVTVDDRLAEIFARYGDGSIVTRSMREAGPRIAKSAGRVTAALSVPDPCV